MCKINCRAFGKGGRTPRSVIFQRFFRQTLTNAFLPAHNVSPRTARLKAVGPFGGGDQRYRIFGEFLRKGSGKKEDQVGIQDRVCDSFKYQVLNVGIALESGESV